MLFLSRPASPRPVQPKEILQNVKVTAAGGKITLTATDMEVGIRLDLEEGVEIETEGTALLPVQRTMAILRESNDETLTFETDDSGIRVQGSSQQVSACRAAIPTSFRAWPDSMRTSTTSSRLGCFAKWSSGRFSPPMRKAAVLRSAVCCWRWRRRESPRWGPTDEGWHGWRERGESIGGHQTTGSQHDRADASDSVDRTGADDKDETVDVAARSNDLLVRTPRAVIYSRLVEGRYPNWRQVFPQARNAPCSWT